MKTGAAMPPVRYDVVKMVGGLDLITPTLQVPPGACKQAYNFEVSTSSGYSRISGYERYDGRTSPATATYAVIPVSLTGSVSVLNTITGVTSGATGVVAYTPDANNLVVTKVSGSFVSGETINVSGSPVGTTTGVATSATDYRTNAIYTYYAAEVYRNDIGAVPGSGAIRGVVYYNGIVYAWRDNAGGTSCDIYKSSTSGWVNVPYKKIVSFTSGGGATPAEGATLTKGSVTATVRRVVLQSGTWSGTAAGYLVVETPSGGSFSSGSATITGGVTLTLSGAESSITQAPGGRYDMIIANFGGSTNTLRIYGADGVNKGFEFDGDVFVPITTGMSLDTPKYVAAHKNYLCFTFKASLQLSVVGYPYQWSPVLGAGEIALGDDITGVLTQPGNQSGGALAVYTRNNTFMLYGTNSSDFQLVAFNTGAGALDYTAQNMFNSYVMDDRGILSLATTLNYGNFDVATLTNRIRPFVVEHRTKTSASSVNREKSQYRVFFSDGWGLYTTIINDQVLGSMPVLFPNAVKCVWSDQDSDGNEVSWFGSDNGYVFKLDTGTSFDGQPIMAYLGMVFNSTGSPRILKRYRKASMEIQGSGYSEFNLSYELGYGSSEIAPQLSSTYQSNLSSSFWDSFTWDFFTWDGRTLSPTECGVQGTGENIAFNIVSESAYWQPFTLNSLIIHYTPRRGIR